MTGERLLVFFWGGVLCSVVNDLFRYFTIAETTVPYIFWD